MTWKQTAMPQGNSIKQTWPSLFIALPYEDVQIYPYELNPFSAIIFCSRMHPVYENTPAKHTYIANITMPIWVMRRGRLKMPVPIAAAIIENMAALNDTLEACCCYTSRCSSSFKMTVSRLSQLRSELWIEFIELIEEIIDYLFQDILAIIVLFLF